MICWTSMLFPTQELGAFTGITKFSNHDYSRLSHDLQNLEYNHISWDSQKRAGLPVMGPGPNSNLSNYNLPPLFFSLPISCSVAQKIILPCFVVSWRHLLCLTLEVTALQCQKIGAFQILFQCVEYFRMFQNEKQNLNVKSVSQHSVGICQLNVKWT